MAQFSSLEQITNLATATQKLADSMQMTQTLGLIGHTVSYTNADGTIDQRDRVRGRRRRRHAIADRRRPDGRRPDAR